MAQFIKTYVRYVLNAQDAYAGVGMMMALYFVALIFICTYTKNKKIRDMIMVPSIIMMAILYLFVPLFNTLDHYLEFFDGRLFWMIITPVVIAVGMTVFISGIEDKKARVAALILVIPLCVLCGDFKLSDSMYKKSENSYKLPQCTVEITEHILSEYEEPVILVPYTIAHPFRQISTNVHLLFGEDATSGRISEAADYMIPICEQMEKVTPDLNMIIPFAKEKGVNYILFDTVYTELCEDGNINIYGYPVDENYVGDRTSTVDFKDLKNVSVKDDEKGVYWDLSEYGLSYDGTYGQYILYHFE